MSSDEDAPIRNDSLATSRPAVAGIIPALGVGVERLVGVQQNDVPSLTRSLQPRRNGGEQSTKFSNGNRMTKIPSIEKTDDYIYRATRSKGAPIEDPNDPHLLLFQVFPQASGPFHSMDITVLRDGHRANDIEFRSFEHFMSSDGIAYAVVKLYDRSRSVVEHDYILTAILRYLA